MWNIIYAGSLAVSIAVFPAEPISSFKNSEISSRQEQIADRLQLAKGRHYESDYRNEADRARERDRSREDYRREDYRREYYRYDPYEVEYDRNGRGRIHRDAEQRRREENLESEQPRYRPRPSRDRRRDRS